MKLLFCANCNDVFAIHKQERHCLCGKTKGHYVDNINAVYSGINAVPLGFHNSRFISALLQRPQEGLGKEFTAFVIPHVNPSFKEEKAKGFSEYVKLKETMGSVGSIVTCDDVNNPNFQIQGSLSNLNCKKRKKKK
jgi:hypothetical protein